MRANPAILLILACIVPALVGLAVPFAYAEDSCAKLPNEDDRLKCYESKIDKKNKEYASTSKELANIRTQKDSVSKKISSLSSQLTVTQQELDELTGEIGKLEAQLAIIKTNLDQRKEQLFDKVNLRNKIVRNYSKRNMLNDLEIFLGGTATTKGLTGFEYATLSYVFNKSVSEEIKGVIGRLNGEINVFEQDKKESENLKNELATESQKLTDAKNSLASQKQGAEGQYKDLDKKEDSVERDLANIQKEISELSSKQQQILKSKYGDEYGSVGDYEAPSASTPNPPFSGKAFAAFSYGAYTHYNGMSQYGAKGRAMQGDDYKEILKFYYKVDTAKKSDFPDTISVQGNGTLDFQKYLYGIAEMPSDWPIEALKAQAIAARTYAYRSNKPICTTQSCQVFNKSKSNNPPSQWKKAVDETKNIILKDPKTSQYSSTTGGYINSVGWDTKGKWPGDAYEKKAGSPWFYKAWYTKSYSSNDSCGHPHPWLTEKEMADILNAWVVWRKGNNGDRDNISPVTTNCWGGNPYSLDKMADRAEDLGEKYTSVSSVDVDISNSGSTSKVKFTTNRGSVSIDGDTFKTVFNLRAPGYISIKSRLFDLDTKN